jgi:hypothetical protein
MLQAEINLRKLELLLVYEEDFNEKDNLKKLKRAAKF